MKKVEIGSKVRIAPQHWLRGYQEALVVDFKPGGQNNWLVKFDLAYPGGGIEGDKLWLDESYFCEVRQTGGGASDRYDPADDESFVPVERGLQ
ncbi:MAG TPA: hypothetical protein VNL14_14655 [Candidatus Acidoferrales bacterium]|nr:hypothetical protein [Candidatus Acidoferrales bacterium]